MVGVVVIWQPDLRSFEIRFALWSGITLVRVTDLPAGVPQTAEAMRYEPVLMRSGIAV